MPVQRTRGRGGRCGACCVTVSGKVDDEPVVTSVVAAVRRLTEAAAESEWRGSDPFDGLWWGWPSWLTATKRRRQAVIQAHARLPIDVRRVYRRPASRIPKTLGLFGSSGLRLWTLTGDDRWRDLASDALDLLRDDRSADEHAWGYPWDVQTRWSFYAANSPNIIATVFAAHALQDGAEALGDLSYAQRASDAAQWLRDALWLDDEQIYVYHRGSRVLVHNANMLGAALVHRLLPEDPTPDAAVTSTLQGQREDGSWPYGRGAANLGFVDSFHTGYVLSSLCGFAQREDARSAIQTGSRYYADRFFDPRGRALLWPDRALPEDGHSAGTAMSTLATLTRGGLDHRPLLERVTARVLSHVVVGGHAVHRRGRLLRSCVKYIRWCDAHVANGLAHVAELLAERDGA